MSPNFGNIDLANLVFPATLKIDWIRVYQPANAINLGCDPPDFPTAAYINEYAFLPLSRRLPLADRTFVDISRLTLTPI